MKLSLNKLINAGMSVKFTWGTKRMSVENSSGYWEVRLCWTINHGNSDNGLKEESKWEGFSDYEPALKDLLTNKAVKKYYKELMEKRNETKKT